MADVWVVNASPLISLARAGHLESLGAGESAVIALALREAGTAVLDDKNARRCARSLGVPVVGTFGVIVRAKHRGLVPAARPVFQALVEAGLFHDDAVVAALLRAVGEPWP